MKLRTTLTILSSLLLAGSAPAAISVFNFNADGDYSSNGPAQMSLFKGNSYGTFGTDTINGATKGVYNFPAATPTQGLVVTYNAAPNGGGAYLNAYTIGYDIKFTNASGYAALFQTNQNNSNDSDLFRNRSGGLGISGVYDGTILSDKWYRLMFSFDLANKTLDKYIDGTQVGHQTLPDGLDGRWSLDPTFIILADNDGETNAGSLSRFYFEDRALNASEIGKFGGANVPEPSSLALLACGALPLLRRKLAR